ncbi:hypothetical protein ABFS83_01G107700 [Erythranthe nasuta]
MLNDPDIRDNRRRSPSRVESHRPPLQGAVHAGRAGEGAGGEISGAGVLRGGEEKRVEVAEHAADGGGGGDGEVTGPVQRDTDGEVHAELVPEYSVGQAAPFRH